jgi:hypothetical protein
MIPDRVACDSCRIEVTPMLTIGDTAGPSILTGRPGSIVTDGKGRYWIGVLDAFPLVYDSTSGTLRQFARQGEGPGEFRHPSVTAYLPGDSLLVRDIRAWNVMTRDMVTARIISHPEQLTDIRIQRWPDRIAALTSPYQRVGREIHTRYVGAMYDMSGGEAVATDTFFATPWSTGGSPLDFANSLRRTDDGFGNGDVWIASYNTYRIVKYSSVGEPVDSVLRKPRWFPGGQTLNLGGPDRPTNPRLTNHWIDDAGRMWVLLSQPRKDTKDAWKDIPQAPGGGPAEASVAALPAEYELNRTVIEVIDLQQKRVLARHTFDGFFTAVLPDNRVAAFVETESGVPVLTIYKLRLQ